MTDGGQVQTSLLSADVSPFSTICVGVVDRESFKVHGGDVAETAAEAGELRDSSEACRDKEDAELYAEGRQWQQRATRCL